MTSRIGDRYSDNQIAFIKERNHLTHKELSQLFMEEFGREGMTWIHIKGIRQHYGFRKSKNAQPFNRYSKEEIAFVKRHKHLLLKDILTLFIKKFDRRDMTWSRLRGLCKHYGIKKSEKNKPRINPIGTEVTKKDFVYIKVHDWSEGYPYALKHKLLWERLWGPVPAGHKLKCLDGNKSNTDPSNWECVSMGVLGRLHARNFENAPTILKPTILAVARLDHAAATAAKRRTDPPSRNRTR